MVRAILAGSCYFAPVMVAAFIMGAVRVTMIAPALGSVFAAVALEVPLILTISWLMAGVVLRHFAPLSRADTWIMGAVAFALLIISELLLAQVLAGQNAAAWVQSLFTPAGMLGLTGQILFGCIPAIRHTRDKPV